MSNFDPQNTSQPRETASLAYFQRSRTRSGALTALSLLVFLIVVFMTVPAFFSNFWLAPILLLIILFAKSFGSWDAYTKMRKQTDVMQRDLDNITKVVEHEQSK